MHRECTLLLFLFSFCLVVSSQQDIFDACRNNKFDVVQDLLAGGVDVNQKDDLGNRAIFIACGECGSFDVIQVLVEHDARLNVVDNQDNTPLIVASRFNSLEVIKFLIEQCDNIDINAFNKNKESALLLACNRHQSKWPSNHSFDLRIVQLLINYDADINHENNNGKTPLILAHVHNNIELVALLSEYNSEKKIILKKKNTGCCSIL